MQIEYKQVMEECGIGSVIPIIKQRKSKGRAYKSEFMGEARGSGFT